MNIAPNSSQVTRHLIPASLFSEKAKRTQSWSLLEDLMFQIMLELAALFSSSYGSAYGIRQQSYAMPWIPIFYIQFGRGFWRLMKAWSIKESVLSADGAYSCILILHILHILCLMCHTSYRNQKKKVYSGFSIILWKQMRTD